VTDVVVTEQPARVPRLGERTVRRPPPGFGHVLGAAAGAFAVIAVVAFVVEVASNDPTAPGIGFDAALAILALLIGFRSPGPLRSAAVTVIVLTVPIIWFFTFFGSGNAGRGEVRGVYILTLVTYLVLHLLGWTRGRAVLLAGVLIFLASWIAFEVQSGDSSVVPFQDQFSSGFTIPGTSSSGSSSSSGNGGVTFGSGSVTINSSNPDDSSIAALATGLVFLAAAALLDRKGYAGSATPFIAVGALEALSGAISLGANHGTLAAALLAVAAGAVISIIGALGRNRRGSTWIGVLAIFGGMVAVLADIAPSSAAAVGGIAAGFAIGLGLIAVLIAPWLGEPDDGGMRTGPPRVVPAGAAAATGSAAAEPATAGSTATEPAPPAETPGPDDPDAPPPV